MPPGLAPRVDRIAVRLLPRARAGRWRRRRRRRVRHATRGLAALRRGRPDRRSHGQGARAGGIGALGAPGGPGGMAQCGRHARGRRDRVLAAEGVNASRLLEAARRGDEDAYTRLVEAHRPELHAHCYRMLGSPADAEDALQETLLRAWRGLPGFAGRSSLRSWLYAIATNVCLRAIERRPKRVLPIGYGPPADPPGPLGEPLVESTWIEP